MIFAVSHFEATIVSWTIRLALVCMFGFFALRFSGAQPRGTVLETLKSLWLIGSFLSLLHAIATMAFHHQFQHQLAFEDTARQTEAMLGTAVGIGIYFNYAFVLLWLIDAMWINGFSQSYLRRSRFVDWVVYGFLGFIAINGAIVFESGPVRWFGALALVVLIAICCFKKRTSKEIAAADD